MSQITNLADLIRDCTKNRQSTFSDISFQILQEAETKMRHKNKNLRNRAKSRLQQKYKNKNEDTKQQPLQKKQSMSKTGQKDKQAINYLELYDGFKLRSDAGPVDPFKLDDKDEELYFFVYSCIKKKKSIFKVDDMRRKIRAKENSKKVNLKECDCCGAIGRHKCSHIICDNLKCEKFLKRQEKIEGLEEKIKVQTANPTLNENKQIVGKNDGPVEENEDNIIREEICEEIMDKEEQAIEEEKDEQSEQPREQVEDQLQSEQRVSIQIPQVLQPLPSTEPYKPQQIIIQQKLMQNEAQVQHQLIQQESVAVQPKIQLPQPIQAQNIIQNEAQPKQQSIKEEPQQQQLINENLHIQSQQQQARQQHQYFSQQSQQYLVQQSSESQQMCQ